MPFIPDPQAQGDKMGMVVVVWVVFGAHPTLLRANSSFCWRSGHTVVTSGSRRSSQSTSSPQLSPDLVTSDLLEEEVGGGGDVTVITVATVVQHY